MKKLSSILVLFMFFSCARTLEKDYRVVDASKQEIPEWVTDLDEWLEDEEDEKEVKRHRYYVYETEPQSSRALACELANAKATTFVAREVSTHIKSSLAQSVNGDPTKKSSDLSQYVQNNLLQEIQATLVGSQVIKTYWEKRRYEKSKGAAKDQDRYVCTSLVKATKLLLKKAFERTQKALEGKIADNTAKAEVKQILEKAAESYTK